MFSLDRGGNHCKFPFSLWFACWFLLFFRFSSFYFSREICNFCCDFWVPPFFFFKIFLSLVYLIGSCYAFWNINLTTLCSIITRWFISYHSPFDPWFLETGLERVFILVSAETDGGSRRIQGLGWADPWCPGAHLSPIVPPRDSHGRSQSVQILVPRRCRPLLLARYRHRGVEPTVQTRSARSDASDARFAQLRLRPKAPHLWALQGFSLLLHCRTVSKFPLKLLALFNFC